MRVSEQVYRLITLDDAEILKLIEERTGEKGWTLDIGEDVEHEGFATLPYLKMEARYKIVGYDDPDAVPDEVVKDLLAEDVFKDEAGEIWATFATDVILDLVRAEIGRVAKVTGVSLEHWAQRPEGDWEFHFMGRPIELNNAGRPIDLGAMDARD